jgi:hypothetical protein
MGIAYNQNRGMAMLKVNGKDVIFSKSFVMKPNDQVSLKVPEIIARDIKIITSGAVSSLPPDAKPFYVDEADDRSTVLTIPFADVNGFVFELAQSQFATVKGPVSLRMSSLSLGATAMTYMKAATTTTLSQAISKIILTAEKLSSKFLL